MAAKKEEPKPPIVRGDREEFGHPFQWYARPGCWHSTYGEPVIVVPPTESSQSWLCIVPNNDDSSDSFEFFGNRAESQAFCIAEKFTHDS